MFAWAQTLRPAADVPYGSLGAEEDPEGIIDPGPGGSRARHNQAMIAKGELDKLIPPFFNYDPFGTNAEVLAGKTGKFSDRTGELHATPNEADKNAPKKVGESGTPDNLGYDPPTSSEDKKKKKPTGLPVHPDYLDTSAGHLDLVG